VKKTSELEGVGGAVIAMTDGLMVAGQMTTGLNPEAIAGFIPQMHGRVTQYAQEMKLGDAKKLTLVIGELPFRIYRLGGLFFAVVGKPEEALPGPQLDVVADHLTPQSK